MKIKTILISFILFFLLLNFLYAEDYITKGPAPGEIYFKAPLKSGTDMGLYHCWDYGQYPILMDSSGSIGYITADADSGGIYHAAAGGGLYYSNNYGNNFVLQSGGETSSISSGIIPGEIYKLALGIRRSEDYGVSFYLMGSSPGGQINVGSMSGELYALYETHGDLFFSSDSGHNFILVNDSIPPQIPFIWKLRHGTSSGEIFLLNSNSQELFYSSDTGRTLTFKYQFNLYPSYEWGLDLVGSQVSGELFVLAYKYFFSGGGEFYIYHSTDYGQTWSSYHHLTEINTEHKNTIASYYLSQNYPNPFNPFTHIKYQLPKPSKVKLEIFNILGQMVKTLVDKYQTADYYTVEWKGLNDYGHRVGSGVYIYRITAESLDGSKNFVKSKKLLMVK